jgi:tellurite resistance protein TehA-like permease
MEFVGNVGIYTNRTLAGANFQMALWSVIFGVGVSALCIDVQKELHAFKEILALK